VSFEDGKLQTIKNFSAEANQPLTLGILIDTSPSQTQVLELEQEAGTQFLREVLPPKEIELPKSAEVSRKEIDIAIELIDSLTEPFKAEQFKDTYHADLKRIIDEKVKGQKPRLRTADDEVEPTAVVDLMDKLQESLENHQSRRTARVNGR
jgi:non-homologous end joining protein Ku